MKYCFEKMWFYMKYIVKNWRWWILFTLLYINNSLYDHFYCDLKIIICLFCECNKKWIIKFQTSNIVYQSKQDIGHDLISQEKIKIQFCGNDIRAEFHILFLCEKNITDYKKNCSFIYLYIISISVKLLWSMFVWTILFVICLFPHVN